jgi:Na+/glutamate symporter
MAEKLTDAQMSKIKQIKSNTTVDNVMCATAGITLGGVSGSLIGLSANTLVNDIKTRANEKCVEIECDVTLTQEQKAEKIKKLRRTTKIKTAVCMGASAALEVVTSYAIGHSFGQMIRNNNERKNAKIGKIFGSAAAAAKKDSK